MTRGISPIVRQIIENCPELSRKSDRKNLGRIAIQLADIGRVFT